MINIDKWVFEFVGLNWFTLLTFFGLLKILAKETKWVLDDKIVTFLAGAVGQFKQKSLNKSQKEIPPKKPQME